MTESIVHFLALLLGALSMSVHFGTWLVEQPLRDTDSGPLFTYVHQGRDAVAAKVMPILGNAAILAIALSTYLAWGATTAFVLSLVGLLCYLTDMGLTLRGNVPINKLVQSWDAAAPPDDWAVHRDRWQQLHSRRTFFVVSGYVAVLASIVLV